MSQCHWVYVTVGSVEQAHDIAHAVVEAQLAAGVNILPGATSVYRWKGEIQRADEAVAIFKTTAACLDALIARVTAMHSYECPCVVALPIASGNPDYLTWIGEQTATVS